MNVTTAPKCVLCDAEAITTAAHIPVCKMHYDAYAEEGRQYLPIHKRPVYIALIAASAERYLKA